jgi:hypothetical protein
LKEIDTMAHTSCKKSVHHSYVAERGVGYPVRHPRALSHHAEQRGGGGVIVNAQMCR